jgi:YfiH family protein
MAETLIPEWSAPPGVHALQTLRGGGCSPVPWDSFNLGDHVGDAPERVATNRGQLRQLLPAEPSWLQQVHGNVVVDAEKCPSSMAADASFARRPGVVCAVMTADCLPVLFCDRAGTVVAAAHAGWRGLQAGVLEQTVASMAVPPSEIMAWLGPAIGPACFEVGDEVKAAFLGVSAQSDIAFVARKSGKWLADIYELARQRLNRCGVMAVSGGGFCTVSEKSRYFSYRRDGITGRMASLIWLEA